MEEERFRFTLTRHGSLFLCLCLRADRDLLGSRVPSLVQPGALSPSHRASQNAFRTRWRTVRRCSKGYWEFSNLRFLFVRGVSQARSIDSHGLRLARIPPSWEAACQSGWRNPIPGPRSISEGSWLVFIEVLVCARRCIRCWDSVVGGETQPSENLKLCSGFLNLWPVWQSEFQRKEENHCVILGEFFLAPP